MKRREFFESGMIGLGAIAAATAVAGPLLAQEAEAATDPMALLKEWDPVFAEGFLKATQSPWTSGILPIKQVELIALAVSASITSLQPQSTRTHIRAALEAGATRAELLTMLEAGSIVALHTASLAAPMLLEEAANQDITVPPKEAVTPASDAMQASGQWNTAWDPFFTIDPEWTENIIGAGLSIYASGIFDAKFIELLSVALDASVTHMYAPGTRRHIIGSLAAGATVEEVMEVIKIAVSFTNDTFTVGLPILAEELDAFEAR